MSTEFGGIDTVIQPDWFEVTEPGVGSNRYAYSLNDPVNLFDPGGNSSLIPEAPTWDDILEGGGGGFPSGGIGNVAGAGAAGMIAALIDLFAGESSVQVSDSGDADREGGAQGGGENVSQAAAGGPGCGEDDCEEEVEQYNSNDINHIFGENRIVDHKLEPVLAAHGGDKAAAYRALVSAKRQAISNGGTVPNQLGLFRTTVRVAGTDVQVRGRIVNGVVRIGTVFVR